MYHDHDMRRKRKVGAFRSTFSTGSLLGAPSLIVVSNDIYQSYTSISTGYTSMFEALHSISGTLRCLHPYLEICSVCIRDPPANVLRNRNL